MTDTRIQEIINNLQSIIDNFTPTEEKQELTYFGLISRYNAEFDNHELIGGKWVKENRIELQQ